MSAGLGGRKLPSPTYLELGQVAREAAMRIWRRESEATPWEALPPKVRLEWADIADAVIKANEEAK